MCDRVDNTAACGAESEDGDRCELDAGHLHSDPTGYHRQGATWWRNIRPYWVEWDMMRPAGYIINNVRVPSTR